MNKTKILNKFIIITIIIFSIQTIRAQEKGTFLIGYGIGLPTRGGLSIQYFVEKNISFEIHAGGFPHTLNYGAAININTSTNLPHPYFVLDLSYYISYGPMEKGDTLQLGGISRWVSNMGGGYKFRSGKNDWFVSAGPACVLDAQEFLEGKNIELSPENKLNWIFYFEGGAFWNLTKRK